MDKYFSYCPEDGLELHAIKEEAEKRAQDSIDNYRDYADDGWDENVNNVCWGETIQQTVKTLDVTNEEAEEMGISTSDSCDGIWDFGLVDVNKGDSKQ